MGQHFTKPAWKITGWSSSTPIPIELIVKETSYHTPYGGHWHVATISPVRHLDIKSHMSKLTYTMDWC